MSKISRIAIKSLVCILTIGILSHIFCNESFAQSEKNKKIRVGFKDYFISDMAYSSYGKLFAVDDGKNKTIKVFDTKTWNLKYVSKHTEYFTTFKLIFMPTTNSLAVVTHQLDESAIWFWNMKDGKLVSKYISPYKYEDREVQFRQMES